MAGGQYYLTATSFPPWSDHLSEHQPAQPPSQSGWTSVPVHISPLHIPSCTFCCAHLSDNFPLKWKPTCLDLRDSELLWTLLGLTSGGQFYPERRRGVYDEQSICLFCCKERGQKIFHWLQKLNKTQCQNEVRILSGRTQKLKVAKRCCKQLNEHNLMYIYHKQCENMQKNQ